MKCPERFQIMQHNIRKPILNDEEVVSGEYHLLVETQGFQNCYKEECAAWDSDRNICRKMEN